MSNHVPPSGWYQKCPEMQGGINNYPKKDVTLDIAASQVTQVLDGNKEMPGPISTQTPVSL